MDFKIISLNTRGFTQSFRDFLFHNLLFEGDIFCFQETKISDLSVFRSFAKKWRGSCFWSPAFGKQGGVLTCLSDSFDYEVVQWKRDTSGRVVSVVIKINDYSINIVNIYAPTDLTERKVFFDNLHEYFLPSDAIVVAGDFNCYEYQSDKTGGNFSCAKYLAHFRSTFNLIDAWHRLNPRSKQCTWFNSDFSIGSRLDKFFVSQSLFSFVSNCVIKPFCFSDHDIVYLTIRLDDLRPRGPGLWKFNNSLLQDTNFSEYISDRMNALIEGMEHFPSVKLWWDFFKNSLKAEIISFSKTKRKNLSHERVVLTNEIIKSKALLVAGDFSVSPVKKLFSFIQICFHLNLLTAFVNKLVLLELKITLIFHNASHARGFYRSKNYLKPSEPSILANRQVLTVFRSNFIYIFGKFWDPFSFALQTNVFVMEIYVTP